MKQWLKNHSLGLVMIALFGVIIIGQSLVGLRHYNDEQSQHQQPQVTYIQYIKSGDFVEATFENWESEFLQMFAYVILTVFLFQKGSAESKKLKGQEPMDADPRKSKSRNAPWPVRRGGIVLKLYENSLSLAFLLLFLMSFVLHAYGGARVTCEENIVHGEPCPSVIEYIGTSKMWYESLQNWQSEFLAVFAIVFLSIYLRQKGSPESKPVNTPHYKTGTE